jgi:urea transporter
MTRHGTLAYYLAAWIVGCPAVALFCWGIVAVRLGMGNAFSGGNLLVLFELLFFALMFGAGDSLLFAFILRRLMRLIVTRNAAIWAMAGAVLAFALVFALGVAWDRLSDSTWFGLRNGPQGLASFAITLLFEGPRDIWNVGWWQVPIEGAGIGAVLGLIDRAFNPATVAIASPRDNETAQAGQTPA